VVNIELGGLVQGTSYDWLNITGDATLDGGLNTLLFGGFTPTAGDTFNIISASSFSGDFASFNLPTDFSTDYLSPGLYQLVYGPASTSPLPIIEEVLDISTDQVIVMNDFQEDILITHAEVEVVEEEEEEKELTCR
jgi:hypothetical protein